MLAETFEWTKNVATAKTLTTIPRIPLLIRPYSLVIVIEEIFKEENRHKSRRRISLRSTVYKLGSYKKILKYEKLKKGNMVKWSDTPFGYWYLSDFSPIRIRIHQCFMSKIPWNILTIINVTIV